MRFIPAAILALALAAGLRAQSTVSGSVADAQTGAPIVGAIVTAQDSTIFAETDASGHFRLTAAGPITSVVVRAIGYVTQTVGVSAPGEPLHVRLTLATTQLPGVQVLARRPAPSVVTLTRQDLDRSTGLDLAGSINALPGVFMQSRTPWGGARITIRGYYPSTSGNSPNANGLGYQVFLNGIPITDATGTTVLDDIDYAALGSVEVIKGPASSRYGSFIGGTVLMHTERPTPGQTSVGQQLITGSNGLLRSTTTFQSAGPNGDLVLNYGHQTYDSFRPHSSSGKDYVRATGDLAVGADHAVSAYVSYNRSFEELAGEIDSTAFYGRIPESNAAYLANNSHINVTSFITGLTDHYRIDDRFSNQTTVFGIGRTANQPFAHGFTDVNQFNFGARTAFSYSDRLGAAGVNGTLGASLQRSNLTSNGVFIVPAPPFPQRPSAQQNFAAATSLFTEWNVTLPREVTLTAGASLNRNRFGIHNMLVNGQLSDTTSSVARTFAWAFTPRAALSKGFHGTSLVYASVSAGYTPPLLGNAVATDGSVNLGLKPERAVQYEIGAQGSLLSERLTGQVALFDLENTDKLVTQTVNSVTFTTNVGRQRNRGAELSLSYLAVNDPSAPLATVRPWLSYSYTDATFTSFRSDNNDTPQTVDYSGNRVPRVPRSMVNAGVDLASASGVYANGTWQYVSRVPVTFDNSTFVRSYDLLGAKVGVRRQVDRHWKLDASVGGDNLGGSTYYSFLFVGPNYQGLAQAQDGGRGDGYIIPAPYKAAFYGGVSLSYAF